MIPYETLNQSSSGVISVDQALNHPQTIPFLGSEATAKAYLAKHREIYGDQIGVWHSDDFNKKNPLGRVLYLGGSYDGGLGGNGNLCFGGRVLAVAPEAQAVAKKLEIIVKR